jgi:hypothetical protein
LRLNLQVKILAKAAIPNRRKRVLDSALEQSIDNLSRGRQRLSGPLKSFSLFSLNFEQAGFHCGGAALAGTASTLVQIRID